MEEQSVEIKGIEVTLFRSLRAKSLNITIKPFTGVRISVPVSVSFEKAKQVATERIGWIRSHLSKMHGLTYNEIEKDKFKITKKIKLNIYKKKSENISESISTGIKQFSISYKNLKPDLIVLLGDRYEKVKNNINKLQYIYFL